MSTPSLSATSTPTANGRSDKSLKHSKVVTLKLSPASLSRFETKPLSRKSSKMKSSSSASTPAAPVPVNNPSTDNVSEANSTPVPTVEQAPPPPPGDAPKKRGVPGPKPGTKRGLGQGVDGTPKPRGKPGPKKKPRLEDGTIDHGVKTGFGSIAPIAAHKLGPKANQGAINAGLRALDRSGKPCRKWARKPFQLKSFTGVVWELSSWRAPKTDSLTGNSDDSETVLQPGESDSKANNSSSAVESEKSNSGDVVDPMAISTPVANSPAPPPAIAAQG